VDEIAAIVEQHQAPLVIFNHDLSPAQMRNLAGKIKARVIDRTMLILDIFALRAKSHEGKVQVELAQLKYLSTRLVGMNTDMGQQKYAVGARGPGEGSSELVLQKAVHPLHLLLLAELDPVARELHPALAVLPRGVWAPLDGALVGVAAVPLQVHLEVLAAADAANAGGVAGQKGVS